MTPTLRIDSSMTLVKAVPYLMGFTPQESLVLVAFARGKVVCTARTDLTDIDENPQLIPDLMVALVRGGARRVVAVIYKDSEGRPGELPEADVIRTLEAQSGPAGLGLMDAYLVSDGRLFSYWCTDACHPREGIAINDEVTAFEAEMVAEGFAVQRDREALAGSLAPVPDQACSPENFDRYEHSYKLMPSNFLSRVLSDPDFRAHQWYAIGVAIQEIGMRDALWLAVEAEKLDGRELWQLLAQRLPEGKRAPALFLFGWTSWRQGNGALASIACELAREDDPAYSAADILWTVLAQGLNPKQVPRITTSPTDLPNA